jgi:hypothetical protein
VVRRGYWWGTLTERDYFEEIGVDGRVILEWILKKFNGEEALKCINEAENGESVGLL